jgi:hypothetical protein
MVSLPHQPVQFQTPVSFNVTDIDTEVVEMTKLKSPPTFVVVDE